MIFSLFYLLPTCQFEIDFNWKNQSGEDLKRIYDKVMASDGTT